MPMTTTTSGVGLAPLIDLLAPPANSVAGGKAGEAFGAILQPPLAHSATDARNAPGSNDTRPDLERSSGSRRGADRDSGVDQSTRDDAEGASHEAIHPDAAVGTSGEDSSDETAVDSETDVVLESLAGMPGCVLPTPEEGRPPAGEPAATGEAAPTFGSSGKRFQGEPRSEYPPVALAAGQSGERVADAVSRPQSAESPGTPSLAEEVGAEAVGDQAAGRQDGLANAMSGAEVNAATAGTEGGNSRGESDEALLEISAEQGESRETKSFGEELELTAMAGSQPADATLMTTVVPSAAGAALPAALSVPRQMTAATVDAPSSKSGASVGSIAIDPQGAARRTRLPGEALVYDAGRALRSASPDIDAPRLLHRVARAFAAAQQRDGEIQLRLSPPELGSLKLTVQMQDGGLVARLETETSSAKTALLDNLPALRERLAEQGLRIERFEVDLMQRQPGGTPDRPSDQERHAPPAPRPEPAVRPRIESSPPLRGATAASNSLTGLNVIV